MILNTIPSRDLLIDAYKFYSREDARAHDALKIIIGRNDMTAAVQGCLDESKTVEEPEKQKLYVKAACFGKKFHPGIAIEEYQSTCRYLRVMNICRSLDIDPNLDLQTVINELILRREFTLARWIVVWLKSDGELEQKVLAKWSEYMIEKRYLKDDLVASKIQQALGQNPVVSYADVANKAIELNRIKLAIKLIESEAQSSKQIPLLLDLNQYDLVLRQALSTCDSNLIFMTIFKLKEKMSNEIQFLELLKKQAHGLAFRYYCNFLAVTEIQKLIMIFYADSSKEDVALYLQDRRLDSALLVCKRTKQEFLGHQIDASIRLNKFQQTLKGLNPPPTPAHSSWVGLSVTETIINLVALGNTAKARDCQKKFEVTDKKYRTLEQIALNNLPKLAILPPT